MAVDVAQHRTAARTVTVAQLLAATVTVAALLGGCSDGNDAAGADAGGDASQEADTNPAACSAPTVCDGTAVRACRGGMRAEIIEQCAPDKQCSLGRCLSISCAEAERNVASFEGCVFYTLDLDNVTFDDGLPSSVFVTNPGQVVATATLERRARGDWAAVATVDVAPMRSARLALPEAHLEGGGLAEEKVFRVTSDRPLTAEHIQSDDSAPGGSTSTGGTMLLPAHVLGLRYRAMTFVQTATPALAGADHRGGAGQIVILATRDRTTVTVWPPEKGSFDPEGGAPDAAVPGKPFQLTLEEGDYYQLYGVHDGDDLTGAEIVADKPVAVFSGNLSTTYGVTATGVSSPDMAHEQLLPVASWGVSYVAASLPPQPGVCDPLLDPPGSSLWRILADRDDTVVTFATPAGVSRPPSRRLRAGESFQVAVPGSFTVTASHPVMVTQGMDCEPTLSSAVPTDPLLTDHYFAVAPGFDTMIALVRRAKRAVFLDGARIEESQFEPIAGGFEVAHIPLEACSLMDGVCTHHVEGQFGLTLRGMDVVCSYALTAPTWIPCTDPGVPGCIN